MLDRMWQSIKGGILDVLRWCRDNPVYLFVWSLFAVTLLVIVYLPASGRLEYRSGTDLVRESPITGWPEAAVQITLIITIGAVLVAWLNKKK